MRIVALLLLTTILNSCSSYKKNNCESVSVYDSITQMQVYTFVDVMPEFKGGDLEMMKYIGQNFKYPDTEESEQQFSFQAQFVVDQDGNVTGARIINKEESDWTVPEKVLIETLNNMPVWNQGVCGGNPVSVLLSYPIRISLN